ncbi:MAG: hypothetical protein K6E79_03835 [Pseudobutyrivibrio sp.]|nr:hypothetical protein [Pseudobutyrivibrio sp.]
MNDFKYKMARFFSGRTGVDNLGRTCTWAALVFMILTMITHSSICYLIGMALIFYSFWRMLSKNYQKRYMENQAFLTKTAKLRSFFSNFTTNIRQLIATAKNERQQRKIYAIFRCPNCKQKLRVPKGHGKIQVTCNKCRTQFIKKV